MRISFLILVAILLAGESIEGQPQPEPLRNALGAFGTEDYSCARTLLESYAASAPSDAPLLYYYIGECYFQAGDLPRAEIWLKRAIEGSFNKQEALWRLDLIAEKKGDAKLHEKLTSEVHLIRERLTAADQSIRCLPAPNPDGTITIPFSSGRKDGLSWAATYWRRGCFEEAIKSAQYWEGVELPSERRLRTERELTGYQNLSLYYEKWAEKMEDTKENQRDVEDARRMARHYSLKAIIIETRGASGKLEKWPKLPPGAVD